VTQDKNLLDPEDKEETAPAFDLDSVLAIHRDPGGFIGVMRKLDPAHPVFDKDGKPVIWQNLFSIRAGDLRSTFPAFAEWLTHDSFFTVSAYYRAAPYKNKLTGLPDVWRKEKYLSKLTACYADLDCGRPESEDPGAALTWRQAQHEAEALADLGIIPQPSIMARSGRGVYLLWLLRDVKDPDKLQHAWPEKIELFKACNRALNERLRFHQLPADPGAIDAARVLRFPGSVHRKALRRVTYVIQFDQNGRGFVYTLPELAAALELPAPGGDLPEKVRELAKPAQYRRVKNPGSAPLRSHGTKALNALRAQDLFTIQTWRGSFLKRGMKYQDGHSSPGRRLMLALYTEFLKGSNVDKAAALASLRAMAQNMTPAYPSDPPDQDPTIESLIEAAYSTRPRKWSNKKLCALLGVTEDVARDLDLKTIRPRAVAHEADQARPLQADSMKDRRELARRFLELHGPMTTARSLAKFYREQGIKGANPQTANEDLNAIDYKMSSMTRSRGGRHRKGL